MMLTIEALLEPTHRQVLLEAVSGSHAYGTAIERSDEDRRGVIAYPARAYLSLDPPPAQIADARGDQVFYSLKRAIELLIAANPNLIELLFTPADCWRRITPVGQRLIDARESFLSLALIDAQINYARTQIKKASGQHKWAFNPQPVEAPAKERFCRIVATDDWHADPPARPKALNIDLSQCAIARLEHARDVFRLYHFGAGAPGVFVNDQLQLSSIDKADERARFIGLLLYPEDAWRRAVIDHQNYWTWRRERNEARWVKLDSGELDYDAKNLMHTMRLLIQAEGLLRTGTLNVRVAGAEQALLLNIRRGAFRHGEILAMAHARIETCDALRANSTLRPQADRRAALALLDELTCAWEAAQ
jgi:uncharacterized protein